MFTAIWQISPPFISVGCAASACGKDLCGDLLPVACTHIGVHAYLEFGFTGIWSQFI